MRTIPSEEECLRILREEGIRPAVVRHACIVKEVAVRIAERCGADLELVRAGGLLHDLGRSRTHGVDHAIEGVRIAKERNLSPKIVKIIQRHLGGQSRRGQRGADPGGGGEGLPVPQVPGGGEKDEGDACRAFPIMR